ncbi:hypothetical protein ID866_7922 [Astraeus odoratus]|nr:hypothetical protein ID866_7922 [Astraeus odoratus]
MRRTVNRIKKALKPSKEDSAPPMVKCSSVSTSNVVEIMSGSKPILRGQRQVSTADPAVHEETSRTSRKALQVDTAFVPIPPSGVHALYPFPDRGARGRCRINAYIADDALHLTGRIVAQDVAKALMEAGNALDVAGTTKIVDTKNQSLATKYLQPLITFNSVLSSIASLNPHAQVALGALTTASRLILSQVNLDASLEDLFAKIG